MLDVATYCKLLEDLLELGTISDCQDVFARIEADLEVGGSSRGHQKQAASRAPKTGCRRDCRNKEVVLSALQVSA